MDDCENDEILGYGSRTGSIQLKDGVNISALLKGDGETFEINFEDSITEEDEDRYNVQDLDLSALENCLGFCSDEDGDDNLTQFDNLAKKMINLTEDGKVKKLIKREGQGETPPDNSLVSILYASYLEYNDEPTDYAYLKKPCTFRLGNAVVYGLNIAVKSMKVNEKALFLIHPDFAFGRIGHLPRIPPNATFLFQVELLKFVDSGEALKFNDLTKDERKQFPVAQKTALGLMEQAKDYFKYDVRRAIREYNKAMSLLEECNLSDMEEQEKQQKLLFKIYTNLAVCYTKENNPKKACIMCNNIYSMSKNTSLFIPAKVYFHNGRALFMLGDYRRAREKLLRAQRLEPHNLDISNELAAISAKMKEDFEEERKLAKAFININVDDKNPTVTDTSNAGEKNDDLFRIEIRKLCQNLVKNDDQIQFRLPSGLTDDERDAAKSEAEKAGLHFREYKDENDGNLMFNITK